MIFAKGAPWEPTSALQIALSNSRMFVAAAASSAT